MPTVHGLARGQACLYRIVGVVSFGPACGIGLPGVYTRVAAYVPWVESVVWPAAPGACALHRQDQPGHQDEQGPRDLRLPNTGNGTIARRGK